MSEFAEDEERVGGFFGKRNWVEIEMGDGGTKPSN